MLTMGHRWLTVIRGAKPYETKYSEVAGNGTSEAMAHFQPQVYTTDIYEVIQIEEIPEQNDNRSLEI